MIDGPYQVDEKTAPANDAHNYSYEFLLKKNRLISGLLISSMFTGTFVTFLGIFIVVGNMNIVTVTMSIILCAASVLMTTVGIMLDKKYFP